MKKQMVGGLLALSCIACAAPEEPLNIAFVDSFRAMRECEEGQKVGKELDAVREKLSKEIQDEAQKVAAEEKDLAAKAATMKKELVENKQRELNKKKRNLETKVRDGEEELKITMQNKTEKLAVRIEESIVEVAKQKGVDAVIDKQTGRVVYTKDSNAGDLTNDAIAYVNNLQEKTETASVQKKDEKKAVAA